MLSIPKYGWVNISIGDWSDRASYLTDVHIDILNALINLLQSHKVNSVYCDAEGWEYIIVFNFDKTYIISNKVDNKKEVFKLYYFEISVKDLAKEVYKDIKENLYAWSLWSCDIQNEENRLKKEKDIKEKLIILNKEIKKEK